MTRNARVLPLALALLAGSVPAQPIDDMTGYPIPDYQKPGWVFEPMIEAPQPPAYGTPAPGGYAPGGMSPGGPSPTYAAPKLPDPGPYRTPMSDLMAPDALPPLKGRAAPTQPWTPTQPFLPLADPDGRTRLLDGLLLEELAWDPRLGDPAFKARVLAELDRLLPGLVLQNKSIEVRYAVDLGADPNLESGGNPSRPLLSVAAEKGNSSIARDLLRVGAAPNARDRATKRTALHWGVLSGDVDLLLDLFEYDADPALKDGAGKTPLDLARSAGNPKVLEMLTQLTAYRNSGKAKFKKGKPLR